MARGEFQRVLMWSVWVTNLLVNICYVLICWATADNLARMSGTLHLPAAPGAGAGWSAAGQTARAFISNSIWRAPIAACAIGGLMAALFNLTSCFVLVRRSMLPPAASSFGYGFVTAWALVLSFTTLLCGLVLEAFKSTVRDQVDPATAKHRNGGVEQLLLSAVTGNNGNNGNNSDNSTATMPPLYVVAAPAGAQGWTKAMTGAYAASYGFAYACTVLYALFFLVLLVFQRAVVARQRLSAPQRAAVEIGAVAASGVGAPGAAMFSSQANAI